MFSLQVNTLKIDSQVAIYGKNSRQLSRLHLYTQQQNASIITQSCTS